LFLGKIAETLVYRIRRGGPTTDYCLPLTTMVIGKNCNR